MPDDEVPVHDVDDQDASGAHELRILLEDLDVRVFVVVPEGRPEVERAVEWRGARRHALRETSQVSDVKRRSTGHALTISEFDCARDEHRRKVYAHGLVAHLRETVACRPMPQGASRIRPSAGTPNRSRMAWRSRACSSPVDHACSWTARNTSGWRRNKSSVQWTAAIGSRCGSPYLAVSWCRTPRRFAFWNGSTIPSGSWSRIRAVNRPTFDAP